MTKIDILKSSHCFQKRSILNFIVRQIEKTQIFRRCKKVIRYFANFIVAEIEWDELN